MTEDSDDYILFYAEGLDTYNIESLTAIFMIVNLLLSRLAEDGKRIKETNQPSGNSTLN
jgi:hypothetical protein